MHERGREGDRDGTRVGFINKFRHIYLHTWKFHFHSQDQIQSRRLSQLFSGFHTKINDILPILVKFCKFWKHNYDRNISYIQYVIYVTAYKLHCEDIHASLIFHRLV